MSAVAITGTITARGEFRPGWWRSAPADSAPSTQPDAEWSVAALDVGGAVIAAAPAAVRALPCHDDVVARLDAALPLPRTAAAVVVRHRDAQTYRREVPAPGGVRLDLGGSEPAPLRREPLTVAVHVDGSVGPGAHLVAVWESPNRPPASLGLIDLSSGAAPAVTVDLAALPGGSGCRLRVVYGDGVRTTTVVSSPVDVEARPAAPVILAPTTGHIVREDGWLTLHGRLGGDGDEDALEWLLDGEPIGYGARTGRARTAAGRHRLTLRHGEESVSVALTVVPAPAPVAPPPWQPPWRFRPVTVHARPTSPTPFGGHIEI